RILGDQHLTTHGVGLNTVGEVDMTPHDAVFGAFVRPDIAHHHFPGMDTNAHFHLGQALRAVLGVHPRHSELHGHGAGHRPFCIIVSLDRSPEENENRITNEFIDRALVLLDHLNHDPQVAIDYGHDLLGG